MLGSNHVPPLTIHEAERESIGDLLSLAKQSQHDERRG